MKRYKHGVEGFLKFIGVFSLALAASLNWEVPCLAQEARALNPPAVPAAELPAVSATSAGVVAVSDRVTINSNGGKLSSALIAFQIQTGRNIVMGPTVTNVTINVNLKDTPWQEALDVMLKPYGFGYKVVGQTIVVNQSKDLAALEDVEPLVSEVFTLKYLDASAVVEIVQKLLTQSRGSVSVLQTQVEKGWEFGSGAQSGTSRSGTGSGVSTGEKRQRVGGSDKTRSKTVIVKDTPTVVQSVAKIIAEIDHMPTQILIESRFVEVSSGFLRDLGLEWGTGATGAETPGVQAQGHRQGGNLFGIGAQQLGGGVTPSAFPQDAASAAVQPFNTGLAIKFQQLTGTQFEMLLHMLEEDNSANILSAPRVLTLNNQEATITVGTQFPIIKSDVSSGTSGGGGISTTLDYYQDIGIQLNVVPQVCGSNYVSLIVHPAVTEQIGVENGQSESASGKLVLTSYPILSTREAETQIILKSGTTVMIGGLLKNKSSGSELKVPFLGSIPLLGQLFRRDTKNKEKLDLLIFLTASIMPTETVLEEEAETLGRAKAEAARGADLIAAAQANATREIRVEREARLNAEQKSQADVAARLEAENRAAQSEQAQIAAEKGKLEAEQRARQAESSARTEREAKAASEKARLAAEKESRARAAKAQREAEKKAKAEAAATAAAEREAAQAKLATERKAKAEADAKAEAAQEAQAKAAKEAERARIAAEKKAKAEAAATAAAEREAARAKLAAERKPKAEAEARAEAAREARAKAAKEAERARVAAEKKAKADAAAKAVAERKAAEAKLASERKAKAEAKARAEAAQEARAKAAREAEQARIAAEKKAKAEAAAQAAAARKATEAKLAAERKAKAAAEARAEAAREAQAKAAKEAARQRLAAEKEAKASLDRYSKTERGGAPVPPVVMESTNAVPTGANGIAGQTP